MYRHYFGDLITASEETERLEEKEIESTDSKNYIIAAAEGPGENKTE